MAQQRLNVAAMMLGLVLPKAAMLPVEAGHAEEGGQDHYGWKRLYQTPNDGVAVQPKEKQQRHQQEMPQEQPQKQRQKQRRRRRTNELLGTHNRIIGGSRAGVDQFPYFAHMLTRGSSDEIGYNKVCGGVLIAPQWVMTASHCLFEANSNTPDASVWGFDVGFYCRHGEDNCGQQSAWIQLQDMFAPTDYAASEYYLNDVALVHLKEPVYDIAYARPDDGRWYHSAVPYQTQLTAIGRGYSNVGNNMSDYLEYAEMTLMDTSDCEAKWGRAAGELEGRVFCMAVQNGVTPCSGDSGGPVLWQDTMSGQVARDEDGRVVITGLFVGVDGKDSDCLKADRRPSFFAQVSTFFSNIQAMVCTGVAMPTWCARSPLLPSATSTNPPTATPTNETCGVSCTDTNGAAETTEKEATAAEEAAKDEDNDSDDDHDDDACDLIYDTRFGSFRPNMSKFKVKTCRWLARKEEGKQQRFCGNLQKSNAADICRKTCCEVLKGVTTTNGTDEVKGDDGDVDVDDDDDCDGVVDARLLGFQPNLSDPSRLKSCEWLARKVKKAQKLCLKPQESNAADVCRRTCCQAVKGAIRKDDHHDEKDDHEEEEGKVDEEDLASGEELLVLDDDDDCAEVVDVRFGSFYPNRNESEVKTCKWLSRKGGPKQRRFCGNLQKSDAASVCRKTCCESLKGGSRLQDFEIEGLPCDGLADPRSLSFQPKLSDPSRLKSCEWLARKVKRTQKLCSKPHISNAADICRGTCCRAMQTTNGNGRVPDYKNDDVVEGRSDEEESVVVAGDDDDDDDDDDDCDGVVDLRFGRFYPELSESEVHSCKWLARKGQNRRQNLCSNERKSDAAKVCARTCCEALKGDPKDEHDDAMIDEGNDVNVTETSLFSGERPPTRN